MRIAREGWAGLALLLLLPTVLLWPSLAGSEVFLPFSAATFPPYVHELGDAQRAQLEAGANLDITEITLTFTPEWAFARDELEQGRLPHWNPYARFGASLLATSVVGMLYPPNWLTFLLLDPVQGLAWNAWFTLVVAGLLMLGLLRELGLSWLAALLGAVAFSWSGTLSANLHFYQRMHALIWLPGMLWALSVMRRTDGGRRARAGVALALCVALSWLAGFPAYAAAALLVAAGFGLQQVLAAWRGEGWRAAQRLSASVLLGTGLGLAMACVQLLPMFAFFPESNRVPDPDRAAIAGQAFDPMGFLGYAVPDAFGSPTSGGPAYGYSLLAWWLFSRVDWDSGVPFTPNYNYIEYAVFPGTLVVVAAAIGVFGAARRHGREFAVIALLALWALSCAGPWVAPLLDLPFVHSVPPMRFVGPACLLVSWLAALGIDRVLRAPCPRVCTGIAVATAVLATGCAVGYVMLASHRPSAWLAEITPALLDHYRPRYPHATPELVRGLLGAHVEPSQRQLLDNLAYGALAFGLASLWLLSLGWVRRRGGPAWLMPTLALCATTAELLAVAWPVNRGRPPAPLQAPAVELLRQARDAHRQDGGITVIRATTAADPLPRALPPGLLVPDRIRDLHAYTFVDARSHRLFRALYGPDRMIREFWPAAFPDDPRLQLPLWDALGVRFVLSDGPLQHAGELRPTGARRGDFRVYERPTALPRAWVVSGMREVSDEDRAIDAMIGADFAPRRDVVVDADVGAALRRVASLQAGAEQRAVTFQRDLPTDVVLDVASGPSGLLVMADTAMRGWRATVDGVPVPIRRGNLFMRVVPLPPRACQVRFRFDTPGLPAGVLTTAAATVVLLWLGLWRLRRRRSPPQAPRGTDSAASA